LFEGYAEALLHHSSLRGRFLAEAIQNVVKNHDIADILDCFVAQNAPRNDDSIQKNNSGDSSLCSE